MNPLAEHQPWWQPYAELLFWIAVAMGLMLFTAYHPSVDDAIKAIVIGVIIAAWSQVTSKITEMRTRHAVTEKAERYVKATLRERLGEPITNDTVVHVAEEVTKEIAADKNA